MARQKLTDALAARAVLPDGKAEAVISDTDLVGFGLRIRAGSKTWIVTYRPAGGGRAAAPKRLKLGSVEAMKAAEARTLARAAMGRVAGGGDPLAERKEAKLRSGSTVQRMLERYDVELERRGYVNRKVTIAGLRTRLTPHLSADIAALTGHQLAHIEDALRAAGKAGAAQDFRVRCRAFLTWCLTGAKVLSVNPLAGFRKERATRADKLARAQHGRALDDAELRQVWDASPLTTSFGRYVRFLVLTGCRRSEAAGLTWAMVDREAARIRLPAAFVKQGRGHDVPITAELAAVLDACPVDARSDLVFASSRSGGRMSGWTQLVAAMNKRTGIDFGLHDLRRTFRTGLSRLGVPTETAELALGHARSDLEAAYNRDSGSGVLRDAFSKWSQHVDNVVCHTTT